MTPLEAYKIFCGVRLHFNGDYDYFKSGPIGCKPETFECRSDKFKFVKLSRLYPDDELAYATAFTMYNKPSIWVQAMWELQRCQEWSAFKNRQSAREAVFQQDIDGIIPGLYSEAVKCPTNAYPPLFMLMGRGFGIDTFLLLDSYHNLLDNWSQHYKDDHVMQHFITRATRLRPFWLAFKPVNRTVFKQIIDTTLGEFKWPEPDDAAA